MKSIEYVRCTGEHVGQIVPQLAQEADVQELLRVDSMRTVMSTVAIAGLVDGACIGCAGVYDIWEGRAMAWALLSQAAGPFLLPISRKVRRVLDCYPARRIEATVEADFEAGHRWAVMLGFVRETPKPMLRYFPDGRDAVLYARQGR